MNNAKHWVCAGANDSCQQALWPPDENSGKFMPAEGQTERKKEVQGKLIHFVQQSNG